MFQFLKKKIKTKEEILIFLSKNTKQGLIDEHTLKFLQGCIKLSDIKLRDIMIDKKEAVALEQNAKLSEVIDILLENKYSRYPVLDSYSSDKIVGIVLAKDMMDFLLKDRKKNLNSGTAVIEIDPVISQFLRPAYKVPESQVLETLLLQMRNASHHCAVAFDEYNHWSGFVSIEDILEEIVGDIKDEHDIFMDYPIDTVDKENFHVFALMRLEYFNDFFATTFEPDEDYKTINGMLLKRFGYVPKKGEKIIIDSIEFSVLVANKRRIEELMVRKV